MNGPFPFLPLLCPLPANPHSFPAPGASASAPESAQAGPHTRWASGSECRRGQEAPSSPRGKGQRGARPRRQLRLLFRQHRLHSEPLKRLHLLRKHLSSCFCMLRLVIQKIRARNAFGAFIAQIVNIFGEGRVFASSHSTSSLHSDSYYLGVPPGGPCKDHSWVMPYLILTILFIRPFNK